MIKKAISASLIGAMFMFSGCGDQEAVDRLASQQGLDKGDYSSTVSTLEAKPAASRTNDENMVLASAYMGQAGFSFSDTMAVLADATSTNTNGSEDTFSVFTKKVQTKMTPDTLSKLQKAIDAYSLISTTKTAPAYKASSLASTTAVSTGDKDLMLGLAYLTKATVVMSYLGDVSKLKNTQVIGNNLLASGCAIVKVYAPSSNLPTGCVSVNFGSSVVENNTTYYPVQVSLAGDTNTYVRWANEAQDQVVLTDYNSTDTTAPTPIQINGEDVTIQDILVDTINNAFTLIEDIAPDDVKGDITKFKTEIGVDNNGKVTATTVSNYIANN